MKTFLSPFLRMWWLEFLLILSSCQKLLETPAPQNQSPAQAVFDNDADAQAAFTGLYIKMMNSGGGPFNGEISLFAGLSGDELGCTKLNLLQDSFFHNTLLATHPLCVNVYAGSYYLIYVVNSALQGIAASTGLADTMKARLRGEAEFDRAFLYFYLVNLYGGVPLALSPDYTKSGFLPRSKVAGVYAQIEADLEDAQQGLSEEYITTSSAPNDRTRPNRAAACALLARVWLYVGQWAAADSAASLVINDGRYQLEIDPTQVFLASSREAIWQLQPVHDSAMATADAGFFIPIYPFSPQYVLTPELIGSFEPGDLRLAVWTASDTIHSQMYSYPFKYRQTVSAPGDPEYEMVLRLAEVYLIRAEARAEEGNLAGAAADLNVVRQRAGLGNTVAADQAGLLAAIQQERRVELFSEWGHRFLDLKRTGLVNAVLGSEKAGWNPDDVLYPLPAQDIRSNPNLVQNPGY